MNNPIGQRDDRFVVCDIISSNFLYNNTLSDTDYTYDELPINPTSTQIDNALNQLDLDTRHIGAIAVVVERNYSDSRSEYYRYVHLIQINYLLAEIIVNT